MFNTQKYTKPSLSKDILRIYLKILAIVFLSEIIIMYFLPFLEGMITPHQEAFLDASALSILISPFIIFLIIKPYIVQRNKTIQKLQDIQNEKEEAYLHNAEIYKTQNKILSESVDETSNQLLAIQERYALAVQASHDGIWDWDLKTNTIYFSPRFKEILGYSDEDFKDEPEEWFARIHPRDISNFEANLDNSKLYATDVPFHFEYQMIHRTGKEIWVNCKWISVCDENYEVVRLVGAQSDLTSKKMMEEKLLHDAYHDPLTNLPNRLLLNDRLEQVLLLSKRENELKFALLLVDLDNFKSINDSLGHDCGDELLVEVAKTLKERLRAYDTIARLGGDEFGIILQNIENKKVLDTLLKDISAQIIKKFNKNQLDLPISFSIGITYVENATQYHSALDILKEADIALHMAKKNGKNQYIFFETHMSEEVSKRFTISTDLKLAIQNNNLTLFYQPIISIKDQSISGFEALIRWKHPTLGWVAPMHFITIAEESDLITDIGTFALEESTNQLTKWQNIFPQAKDWFMAINVSGRQLEDDQVYNKLKLLLRETKLNPSSIKLEITENILISMQKNIQGRLHKLKSLGVQLALDDFGTGYSALSILNQFEFDTLKIDRSFISHIDTNPKSKNMVKMIQLLASSLNMKSVVEGVEDNTQYAITKEIGCDYVQGFLFSEPLAAQIVEHNLKNNILIQNWHEQSNKLVA